MVSPSSKRRAVNYVVEEGLGVVSQACRALGLARSGFYRPRQMSKRSQELKQLALKLSGDHPRYGYRRITALMRREGHEINAKRVQRLRREEGLQVRKRQRRMRRLGNSTSQRRRASYAHEVWSWDFVEDQTAHGSRFRILTLIDEYSRQCLAVHVAWSIRAVDVIEVVEQAIKRYGRPKHIRSDNGPEFIAYAITDWLESQDVGTIYIRPGSPWEQAYIESFHDKLRDEHLNRELFGSLKEARILTEQWRCEYNLQRPHSSLSYLTPHEFALTKLEEAPPKAVETIIPQKPTSKPRPPLGLALVSN